MFIKYNFSLPASAPPAIYLLSLLLLAIANYCHRVVYQILSVYKNNQSIFY